MKRLQNCDAEEPPFTTQTIDLIVNPRPAWSSIPPTRDTRYGPKFYMQYAVATVPSSSPYPVNQAGMSIEALKRAASRPEHWHSTIRKRAALFDSRCWKVHKRPAITLIHEGAWWPLHFWRMNLVPGGRFLVALSPGSGLANATAVISIYNLGQPGSTNQHVPAIVASQSFDAAYSKMCL